MSDPKVQFSWSSVPSPVREHLAVIGSAALAVFVAVRVFAVAGFVPETAYVILQTQGTGSILMGTLINALLLVPFAAGCVLLAVADHRRQLSGEVQRDLLVASALAIVGTLLLMPVIATGILLAFPAMVFVLERLWRSRSRKPRKEQPNLHWTQVFGAMALVLVFATAISPVPWLPHERLTDGKAHVDGYVLGVDGENLVVLRAEKRKVLRVPIKSDRRFCVNLNPALAFRWLSPDEYDWFDKSWAELIVGSESTTVCDDE